ncbi:MAG: FABP family protein [bacterium]|nr:FABP family protein [bacterium]
MSDQIEYGPLELLIGTWRGDKGTDLSPEPEGSEESGYYETLCFTPIGDVENAESQVLAILRYQQIVQRKSNDEVFHDQTGYWMWDAQQAVVMQSIAIPRAVCVLAGGRYEATESSVKLSVAAKLDDPDWGIIQSPFMRDRARTVGFQHELSVVEGVLSYSETTSLLIYDRSFEHTDGNQLRLQP